MTASYDVIARPKCDLWTGSLCLEGLNLDSQLTRSAAGNLTADAQLAALAIEHQAGLPSASTDIHRFAGLRWRNPLT